MVSEGLRGIEVEGRQLPILKQVPIWEGDHMPTLAEMREVSATQADVETQARRDRMANAQESSAMLRELGIDFEAPSHWPIVVQRRRVGRFLGFKSLGQFNASDLFVDDDTFELPKYWRHSK